MNVEDKKPDEGPVALPTGLVLGEEWRILKKLGEGACGAVYLILKKLTGKKYVAEMLHSGKKERFQYVVMTLLGDSLANVIRSCGKAVSVSTMLRVGVHMLHGLKQIHDAGFIHRDIKPANLALGNRDGGTDPNFTYILDFGLSREFVTKDKYGKLVIRKPRRHALFRGTTRYCSVGAHERQDQGRVDDLWSMVYVLVELRGKLPWSNLTDKKELAEAKRAAEKRELFSECPCQIKDLSTMLRKMDYWARPDYYEMYRMFVRAMNEGAYKWTDPWDWQMKGKGGGVHVDASPASNKGSLKSQKKKKADSEKNIDRGDHAPVEDPFNDSDFDRNDLGL